MKKKSTVEAQKVKAALIIAARKIGKRKRMTAAQLFQLVCDSASE